MRSDSVRPVEAGRRPALGQADRREARRRAARPLGSEQRLALRDPELEKDVRYARETALPSAAVVDALRQRLS